ncbi:hypothetical protein HNQ60_005162 [Povalibacter uvarum]|uniref:Peptidase M12B domain-containing protein n=1 Tax=Povalibacter uvarum TaxID=732238 RepID=A0A841HVM0_9GAMM|nr:M12 family metallo-peptidase [Povalibacter uvarum]MBB6096240.1 hypothetical protein [Povalibacter uvarum]
MLRRAFCHLSGCVLLLFGVLTHANDFRVLYAEEIDLPVAVQAGPNLATAKPQLAPAVSIAAYGRQFDLQLESNDALVRTAPTVLAGKSLFRGTIAGMPGSWIRMTASDGEVHGAIWDGTDYYIVAPASQVQPHMDSAPGLRPDATMIYRLSDTVGGVSGGSCTVVEGATERGAALTQYLSMVRELKSAASAAAAGIPLQIEVALLGDKEFAAAYPDAQAAMLARINIVDGIFTQQVGVSIIPTDFVVSDGADSPLIATAAPTLLEQVSTLRRSTDAVRARGLAHLLTGKGLDGSTVGIAYIDALCSEQYGVSLSEAWSDAGLAALIIAHELGHNFGAPHDGEAGSACSDTPDSYLMAPALNFSSTFSSCSRQQMATKIAAASCIVPLRIADAAVDVSNVQGYVGEIFELPVNVRSVGELTARNMSVTVDLPSFAIDSAQMEGGSCSISGIGVTCQLSELAPGEARRMTVRASSAFIRNYPVNVRLQSATDRNAVNNNAEVRIAIGTAADIRITSAPASIGGMVRTPFDFSLNLESTGVRTARNVEARFFIEEALQIVAATPSEGSCSIQDNVVLNCTFGDLPVGSTRRIDLTARATEVRVSQYGSVEVTADNDAEAENNRHYFPIRINPERDLQLDIPTKYFDVGIDTPFDVPVILRSAGTQATSPAVVTFGPGPGTEFTFDSVGTQGGMCSLGGGTVVCNMDAIEAGGTRTITLRLRAPSRGQFYTNVTATSAGDDAIGNNESQINAVAWFDTDLELNTTSGGSYFPYAGVRSQSTARLRSWGLTGASNFTVTATFPSQFTILAASLDGGSCTIEGQSARCVRTTALARNTDAFLRVDTTASQVGTFTASVTADVPGDGATFNNQIAWQYQVREGQDVRLSGPTSGNTTVGTATSLDLTVATGNHYVDQVVVDLAPLGQGGVYESATVNGGSCVSPALHALRCYLTTMQANTTKTITVRFSAAYMTPLTLHAIVSGQFDVITTNNEVIVPITVADRQGDASVQAQASTVAGDSGKTLSLPTVSITTTDPVDDAKVRLSIDDRFATVRSATAAGGTCSFSTTVIECLLGTVERNTTHTIAVTLTTKQAGSFQTTATLTARNDSNPANNSAVVSVTVRDLPPPTSPPSDPGKSGGGGGGSTTPLSIALLLSILYARRRYGLRISRSARGCRES